jgi:UDP-glucose 4-epimerase
VTLSGSTVLVTGGAGFIGSHIVEDLVQAGARVRVLDDLSSGRREHLEAVRHDVELVEGTILDPDVVVAAARGADAICHQAAQLEIIRCIEDPVDDLRSNTEGTLNVLEAAKRCDVPKVVYASSACVYGQAEVVPSPEEHPTRPNWPYGISKLATEHYARLYNDYYGIETAGLRYSIVFGPREWYGRVLTAWLRRALDGEPPVVWGGHQQRDFVYVADVARANVLLLEADGLTDEVFNVSTGIGTSIRELADLLSGALGLPEPIFEELAEGEASEHLAGRIRLPAELERLVLDPSRIGERLGWRPETALRDGIQRELEWLRAHADLWTEMHY